MPCVGLASRLLKRVESGTRWPELVDVLYSRLLRLKTPIFHTASVRRLVERMAMLIDEDRLPELLQLLMRVEGAWSRRRNAECMLLGVAFLAVVAFTAVAPLLGLALIPVYAAAVAYLLNRQLC